jgi:hypothetical protein
MSVLAAQRAGNKVIQAEGEAQAAEKLAQVENIIGVSSLPPSLPPSTAPSDLNGGFGRK